jgi:hypothetical protein
VREALPSNVANLKQHDEQLVRSEQETESPSVRAARSATHRMAGNIEVRELRGLT